MTDFGYSTTDPHLAECPACRMQMLNCECEPIVTDTATGSAYDAGYAEAMRRVVAILERAGCADGLSVLAASL